MCLTCRCLHRAPLAAQVIADSIKAYVAFEKKLVDALPKEERATARPIDIRRGQGWAAGWGVAPVS